MAAVPELASQPASSINRPDPSQGVFETVLVLDGCPVELDAHLARLYTSLSTLYPNRRPPSLDVPGVKGPYATSTTGTSTPASLRILVAPTVDGALEARVETREVPPGVVSPARSRAQDVDLLSLPLAGGLGAHKWADRALLDETQARLPAGSLPLIVEEDGTVLEASRANVFAVRGGGLATPPLDGRILPGVTRMRVLEGAAALGIEARETELSRADLLAADEVFLTGSVRGVEPAASLDGEALPGGGPVASALAAELRRAWLGAPVA